MLSAITESRPPERLSIKYIGVVNQGIDDTESDAAGAWRRPMRTTPSRRST